MFILNFVFLFQNVKQLNDQQSKNDEFKSEKATYHANQISEHSKIEETVKDDFKNKNNNLPQDGEVKLVFFKKYNFFT